MFLKFYAAANVDIITENVYIFIHTIQWKARFDEWMDKGNVYLNVGVLVIMIMMYVCVHV